MFFSDLSIKGVVHRMALFEGAVDLPEAGLSERSLDHASEGDCGPHAILSMLCFLTRKVGNLLYHVLLP